MDLEIYYVRDILLDQDYIRALSKAIINKIIINADQKSSDAANYFSTKSRPRQFALI